MWRNFKSTGSLPSVGFVADQTAITRESLFRGSRFIENSDMPVILREETIEKDVAWKNMG